MSLENASEAVSESTSTAAPETSSSSSANEAIDTVSTPNTDKTPHPIASKDPVTKRTIEADKARKEGRFRPKTDSVAPPVDTKTDAQVYTPNFKFRANDQDHEIPEHMRAVIKDAESEKAVKELFEKAYGLDTVKTKAIETKEKLQKVSQELSAHQSSVNELRTMYQRGDLDSFFKTLNIPEEKILQYALDKVNYHQLPPEQKAVMDARRDAENRAVELEKQNRSLSDERVQALAQAKRVGLDTALARAEIKAKADAYDAAVGKTGAFMDKVIQRGEYEWLRSQGKVDLSPEQAIQAVIGDLVGLDALISSRAAPQAQLAPEPTIVPANPARAAAIPPKTPTLPNVNGRASTPLRSKPKNLDELKKLAATFK